MKIAFLHTLASQADKFERLVKKVNDKVEVSHYINEALLKTALAYGKTDTEGFNKEIIKIKETSPDLIVCSCSTYGDECDRQTDVERIDRPIANYLVKKYKNIALAYTASSTYEASKLLLLKSAGAINKEIVITRCDCTSSWPDFEKGDMPAYEEGIAKEIRLLGQDVEAVFLAQASMSNVVHLLQDMDWEIVASAEFGVRFFVESLLQSD